MLRQMELTYVVRDELLIITTPEVAERELSTRVYRVKDFVEVPEGMVGPGAAAGNLDALVQLIHATIAPDAWNDVGGVGAITGIGPWGLLVVSQSDEVQRQVAGLLSAARKVAANVAGSGSGMIQVTAPGMHPGMMPGLMGPGAMPPGSSSSPSMMTPGMMAPGMPGPMFMMPGAAERRLVLKPYMIAAGFEVAQLSDLIKGTIRGPWTEQAGEAGIFPVGRMLLIRQTPESHRQIEELLRAIHAIGPGAAHEPPGAQGGFF